MITFSLKKIASAACLTGTFAALVLPFQTFASPITGQISFSGSVLPYSGVDGTGPITGNYTQVRSIGFSNTVVAAGATGIFANISAGSAVDMYSPLQVNPAALPNPSNASLWNVGGFFFTLSSISEPTDTPTFLVLNGYGSISDAAGDTTPGTWTAALTSSGIMFSWNSTTTVPEHAWSILLFGGCLASMALFYSRPRLASIKA